METIVVKSEQLNLPEKIAKKLKGKELEIIETKEGILLKPVESSVKSIRGLLKGSGISTELFMQLKQEEKELERKKEERLRWKT
jgi:virulence-associated protein VagC